MTARTSAWIPPSARTARTVSATCLRPGMVLTPVTRIPSDAIKSGIVQAWAETGRSTTTQA